MLRKSAIVGFALALTAACAGLWLLINVASMVYHAQPAIRERPLPGMTRLCLELQPYVLAVPIPFLLGLVPLLRRSGPSPDAALFYLCLGLLVMTVLFFVIVASLMLAWAGLIHVLGEPHPGTS